MPQPLKVADLLIDGRQMGARQLIDGSAGPAAVIAEVKEC